MASLSEMFKMQVGGFPPTTYGSLKAPGTQFASLGAQTPTSVRTNTLPNGGGTYQTPVVAQPTAQVAPVQATPLFNQPAPVSAPATPSVNPAYLNPQGGLYTPSEIAANAASKQPAPVQGAGDIPAYAGNALTQGPQTTPELQQSAAGLNNTRNDIATGTTDPYGVASKSGVAYSPAELKAIESAYAGVYDPAINSALSKLDLKQKQDAAQVTANIQAGQAAQKFQYDVALKGIPTYIQAVQNGIVPGTTTPDATGGTGVFSSTQQNKGASNAGMDLATFRALSADVKNFYINAPTTVDPTTGKATPKYEVFNNLLADVSSGTKTPEEVTNSILSSTSLPQAVKQHFIDLMPVAPEVKQGIWQQFTTAVGNALSGN